jgi:hypothetical protein
MPLFLTAAWITGLANGLAAAHLLRSNPQPAPEASP